MIFDVGNATEAAVRTARDRLSAQAQGGAPNERGMAGFAATAIFEEALLAAIKARLGELKMVSK